MTAHTLLKQLVGAPGFEPGASCAQDRQPSFYKSFDFNHAIENSTVNSTRELWLDVARCTGLIVGSLQKSLHFPNRKGTSA
jgi:hypothetical protein